MAAGLLVAACSSSSSSSGGSSESASSGSALAAAPTCDASADNATTFKLGTFLPLTGSLASLGPAAVAGSGQALSEINKNGGVNGKDACIISTDSSDTNNPTIGAQNIQKLLQSRVSAILGAESSSVTENVLPTVAASNTVMFSPANTDDKLTGISKWYFRNAPPNSVEGDALGKQIVSDGNTKVALLVFNDSYGTNLRDSIEKSITGSGGQVTYGAKGKGQEFPSTQTDFGSTVSAALGTQPDAVVIDAFDQTTQILPALASAGWNMKKVYLVDGNLNDYSKDAGVPDLTGAKGSTQGINPSDEFKDTLQSWYKKNENSTITGWGYAAESYDAVITMALAAEVAGKSDPASIQANILPVTGTQNGTKCKTFAECSDLIKKGTKNIWYQGPSGIGPLTEGHDPSSGYISIYQYVGKAPSKFLTSVKGTVA
ncbi:ABC transporter substrate-binding protein [Gordonia jinhuaensis]|uniref:ABC transporter substrate-binding protein n=1 Tax=Gordonia jinhuaensis TaxID=1517702 RepID=UPI001669AEA0|nr:ABC transporter substrate-binding protein [Gordonia jinhuaensis]